MRSRSIAAGCVLIGAVGLLGMPRGIARAAVPAAATTQLSVSAGKGIYGYGARVIVTVTLDSTVPGGTVSLYAKPAGLPGRLIVTRRVNARHKLSAGYTVTRTTRFIAVFAGGSGHRAARAARTVQTRARVESRMTNYFKKVRFNGHTYFYFHAGRPLTLHSTVTPNKHGECLEPETQQWDRGKRGSVWDADTKYGCDALDRNSHDDSPFDLSSAAGDKYRIRGDYIRGRTDTANLSAVGPWMYFVVVR